MGVKSQGVGDAAPYGCGKRGGKTGAFRAAAVWQGGMRASRRNPAAP